MYLSKLGPGPGPVLRPRVLSLFTVVKFSNSACSSRHGSNGTCYTAAECAAHGGRASGSCAHGFGSCCVFSAGCGEETRQNGSYLALDTAATDSAAAARSCRFRVCAASAAVCKLRLDFESLTLTGPQQDNYTNAVDSVVKNSHSIVGQVMMMMMMMVMMVMMISA